MVERDITSRRTFICLLCFFNYLAPELSKMIPSLTWKEDALKERIYIFKSWCLKNMHKLKYEVGIKQLETSTSMNNFYSSQKTWFIVVTISLSVLQVKRISPQSFKLQRSSNEVLPSKINHNAALPKTSLALRNVINPSVDRRSNWDSWSNTVLSEVQVTVLIARRKKPNRTPTSSTLCFLPGFTTNPSQLWATNFNWATPKKGPHLEVSRLTGRCSLHPHPTQIHSLFSQCRKNNHFSLEDAQLLEIHPLETTQKPQK